MVQGELMKWRKVFTPEYTIIDYGPAGYQVMLFSDTHGVRVHEIAPVEVLGQMGFTPTTVVASARLSLSQNGGMTQ